MRISLIDGHTGSDALKERKSSPNGKGAGQDALGWQEFGSRSGANVCTQVPSTRKDGNPYCLNDIFLLISPS